MRWRDARALFDYWREWPPEGEMLVLLAQVYTTWRPEADKPATPEDHMRSLEARWKAGAMNAKQLVAAMGGKTVALGSGGTIVEASGSVEFPDVRH